MIRNRNLWLGAVACLALSSAAAAQDSPNQTSGGPALSKPDNTVASTHVKAAAITPVIHYEATNPGEMRGDHLAEARRIAATIVAADMPAPHSIIDVGSFTGELLEAFIEQFPNAHGQWTEPVDGNLNNAHNRLDRFGKRVSFVIGCPARDISQGCVPPGVDVLLTSWLSVHQDRPGIRKFYQEAYAMLPDGGWMVTIDHVGSNGDAWEKLLHAARPIAVQNDLAATTEGPPVHHRDWTVPTLDERLDALRAAGFHDPQVVWRRLDTVLIMAKKSPAAE